VFLIFLNLPCAFQIDVNLSFEKQGPLHVFLHKLTDMQSHAESGDKNVRKKEEIQSHSFASLIILQHIFCRLKILFRDFKSTLPNIQI